MMKKLLALALAFGLSTSIIGAQATSFLTVTNGDDEPFTGAEFETIDDDVEIVVNVVILDENNNPSSFANEPTNIQDLLTQGFDIQLKVEKVFIGDKEVKGKKAKRLANKLLEGVKEKLKLQVDGEGNSIADSTDLFPGEGRKAIKAYEKAIDNGEFLSIEIKFIAKAKGKKNKRALKDALANGEFVLPEQSYFISFLTGGENGDDFLDEDGNLDGGDDE